MKKMTNARLSEIKDLVAYTKSRGDYESKELEAVILLLANMIQECVDEIDRLKSNRISFHQFGDNNTVYDGDVGTLIIK